MATEEKLAAERLAWEEAGEGGVHREREKLTCANPNPTLTLTLTLTLTPALTLTPTLIGGADQL